MSRYKILTKFGLPGGSNCDPKQPETRTNSLHYSPQTGDYTILLFAVAYPGIFFGGGSTNLVEDRGQRGRGSGGGSPLVRGSGGSCNLVQEISFHIVKFS